MFSGFTCNNKSLRWRQLYRLFQSPLQLYQKFFLLNNSGYPIKILLYKNPARAYSDITIECPYRLILTTFVPAASIGKLGFPTTTACLLIPLRFISNVLLMPDGSITPLFTASAPNALMSVPLLLEIAVAKRGES
jgi:hypothetical protein